jgi:ubiquitin-like modifier-activating enzyme ATG7
VARNDIFIQYSKGKRLLRFQGPTADGQLVLVKCDNFNKVRYTGWSSATLTTVNLSQTMDPHLIAEQNAELNLKLMMWKHEPDLPLDRLRKVKCLLIGAGTVGCSVARLLISWGVRNITFVDCARVSPSNPVRQNLYTSNDIGKDKASTAAESLTAILPSISASGYTLDVPMPGHKNVGTDEDITALDSLIENCDIVFLSTDSREGRWLPIALAKLHNKDVMNIALGYESLLVQHIKEDNGCYFCTFPEGPSDTMSSRTIDEKCTITRPGVSFLASALSVEFFVDIIRGVATHHQIRYNLSDMRFMCYQSEKHPVCPCCSVEILSELADKRYQFIEDVKVEPSIIEDLCGYADEYGEIDGDVQSLSSEEDQVETHHL